MLAAMAFDEPRAAEARTLLADADLYEPLILPFELAQIALKKTREHPERRDGVAEGLADILSLEFHWIDLGPNDLLYLAIETRLSVYDAAYLAAARLTGAHLITFDARLQAAIQAGP